MQFATPSLRRTRRCLTKSVAHATISSIGCVCTSGSRTAEGTRARCVAIRLTIWGRIRSGGGQSMSEDGECLGWVLGCGKDLAAFK